MSSALYRSIISTVDKFVPVRFRPMWEHPAGPKTVFFWAPLAKLTIVLAGIGDLQRPPENISVSQASTLATTGLLWARYSLIITPKNYSMCAVNLFMSLTQSYQLYRGIIHQQQQKGKT